MSSLPKTAEEWQSFLDEKFPEGAVVSAVRGNGLLSSDAQYQCPVLVVVAMRGEWPLIVGLAGDGMDLQMLPASWREVDRSGHYAARVKMAPVKETRPGEVEISSWLSPAQVTVMAPYRESQRSWLLQVAASAEEEVQLEVANHQESEERAPSAELTDDMALTLTRI